MLCSSCGKQIPKESRFCLHCGAAIKGKEESPNVNNPPAYIKMVYRWLIGQTVKKGFLGIGYREFQLSVVLADEQGQPMPADGVMRIKISGLKFETTVNVKKEDFVSGVVKPFGDKLLEQFVFCYRHLEPIAHERSGNKLEVWFTPKGSKQSLYYIDEPNPYSGGGIF